MSSSLDEDKKRKVDGVFLSRRIVILVTLVASTLVFRRLFAIPDTILGNPVARLLAVTSSNNQSSTDSDSQFQQITPSSPQCHKQPLEVDNIDYTLCLQSSEDRLWMMKYHCERWHNFISLVVHTNRSSDDIHKELVEMGCIHHRMKVNTHPIEPNSEGDYPINHMRNIAIAAATTTHVFNLDMDFWTDINLYRTLQSSKVRKALVESNELAIVVPALSIYRDNQCRKSDSFICNDRHAKRMPTDRESIMQKVHNKEVTMFDVTNAEGHDSTGYRKWFKHNLKVATFDEYQYGALSLRPLDCLTSNRYEPYVVFRKCESTPPFQESFTGYGKNKLTWIMHLRHLGWTFSVLDDGFITHFPHRPSASRKEWNNTPEVLKKRRDGVRGKVKIRPSELQDSDREQLNWMDFKRGKIDKLFVVFKDWLEDSVEDNHKVPLCDGEEGASDDDRLWVAPSSNKR